MTAYGRVTSLEGLLFLFTQRRRVAKPQRDFFLCVSPSLRDILFSREATNPVYGRVTCFERSSFFVHAKAQSRKGISFFASPLRCCLSRSISGPPRRIFLFTQRRKVVKAQRDLFLRAKAQRGIFFARIIFWRVLINHSLCEQFRF